MATRPTLVLSPLLVLLWLHSLTQVELQARGYLHAAGVRMINSNQEEVLLNGVNLGSWLFPEAWMMGGASLAYPGADTFEQLNAAVLDVMGGDTNLTAQVLGAMRSNYVTAADISFLASHGFNSVRVPFHYELFFQITNAAASYPANGHDLDTGFNYLDNLLSWCSSNGVYVLPDMHGVPGGKDSSTSGCGIGPFWTAMPPGKPPVGRGARAGS